MSDSTLQKSTGKRLPPNAGKGRKKGVPNRITKTVKEMLTEALDRVGGVEYLARMAEEQPQAFLSLIAKLLPSEIKAAGVVDIPTRITYRINTPYDVNDRGMDIDG